MPRWLNEGVAEYVVGARTQHFTRTINVPIETGSLVRCIVEEACDRPMFYSASASMVDYLVKFRGMVGIRDVLDALKRGQSIDFALDAVFEADERGLAREWETYVVRRAN